MDIGKWTTSETSTTKGHAQCEYTFQPPRKPSYRSRHLCLFVMSSAWASSPSLYAMVLTVSFSCAMYSARSPPKASVGLAHKTRSMTQSSDSRMRPLLGTSFAFQLLTQNNRSKALRCKMAGNRINSENLCLCGEHELRTSSLRHESSSALLWCSRIVDKTTC